MDKTNLIEYAVIGAYFIFMIITGIAFRRFNRNFSDYFRSGCRGTWWLVGGSVFMASFTAWTFTGAAGAAYEAGLAVAVIFFSNGLGYVVNALITAPLFRQMRAITGPEIIRQRFDTVTQQFYVWVGMIPGILMSSLTLWGVALFASSVFGYNVQMLVVVLGLVVLIYSTLGGSWSVMATDFLQALILMPMTILVAWLSLKAVGGVDGLFAEIHTQGLDRMTGLVDVRPESAFNTTWALAIFTFVMITYNSFGSSSKYFTCKDGREARKAALLAAVLMLAGAFLWFVPPIIARLKFDDAIHALAAANPNISNPGETAYAVIAMKLLPNGMTGMIVVAMFAATMSSLSPAFNQNAAIITQDVYKPFLRPQASDREMFIVGQIASMVFGFLIILSALYFSMNQKGGLFDYMLKFGSIFGTPTVIPMFLALFIRRTPPWSAIVSVLCSAPLSALALIYNWRYEYTVFSIVAAGSAGFLATMPWWRATAPEARERIGEFYRRMHTPVDFGREVGKPNDPAQLKLVGYVSLSIGLFMLLILLVPNPPAGRLQILFVAGSIIAFGGCMVLTGAAKQKRLQS
ncbi:MAG: sodium/solute symporter [bacterium]|nr:sodium/solute symporter [Candidatus Sumerlaeota bacterium]